MKCTHPFMSKLFAPKFLMRFKFPQGTQVDHSRLRRSGRAFPSPRPPSPMVDLWQVYVLVQLELYCVKYQAHKLTLYNLHLLAYVVIAIVVCLVHPVHSSCVHIQYISRLYVTVLGKSCVQLFILPLYLQ